LYLVCIGALLRLRNRFGNTHGALRVPGGHLAPVLAAVVCVGLLTQVKALAYVSAGAFLAVGSLLYVVARPSSRDHRHAGRRNNAAIKDGASPPGARNS
jgi:hypothetical protein